MPYNLNFKFLAPENSIFQTGENKEYYKTLENKISDYSLVRL